MPWGIPALRGREMKRHQQRRFDKEVAEEVGRNSVEQGVLEGKLKVFQWGENDQLHKMCKVQLRRGLRIDGFGNVEVLGDLHRSRCRFVGRQG